MSDSRSLVSCRGRCSRLASREYNLQLEEYLPHHLEEHCTQLILPGHPVCQMVGSKPYQLFTTPSQDLHIQGLEWSQFRSTQSRIEATDNSASGEAINNVQTGYYVDKDTQELAG